MTRRRQNLAGQLQLPLDPDRPTAEEIRAKVLAWHRRRLEREHLRILIQSRVEFEQLPN